jgi:4-aminobutyrate aminotransferase-like enzyme/Ser/Thr protein kinase RdoA (MazF antagonist)
MKTLLSEHYNLEDISLTKMEGYNSSNYRVDAKQGKFVLKVYPVQEKADVLAETAMIQQLAFLPEDAVSNPIKNVTGDLVTHALIDGEEKILRLMFFVEGQFIAEATHTDKVLRSLGSFIGKIDHHLIGYKNIGIQARNLDWDLKNINVSRQLKHHITSTSDRKLVEHFFIQWDQHVYPKMTQLRKSIIHNDANDWNVLVKDDQVSGIIDFGDTAHTAIIFELAITLTYAMFGKDDPIASAIPVIEGYQAEFPLFEEELDLLYYLIAGRLCMGVCTTANEKKLQPDNKYILISEAPGWELLRKWITISPVFARNQFYEAAGFELDTVPSEEEILTRRHKFISSIFSVSYRKPLYVEAAAFQYMYDKTGNTILDAYNNIPHVGHQHPKVVEAAQRQMAQLNTNTRYLYDPLQEYAEKLLSKFSSSLTKVYFVNSGSAASDLAIRLAQKHTQRQKMVVMEHGYHGNTRLGVDISHYKYTSKGGTGLSENIIEATIPDTYRGLYKNNNGEAGQQYAGDLIKKIKQSEGEIAGFITEPIVGCGGQVPLAKDYLKLVYKSIREQGGVCISDEVQTGFGRLGSHFWGYEMYDIVPDIVVLGKPMGNGHPIGAVITSDAIADSFDNGMEFFSSFGGNPVSCAIGFAVLNVIEEEKLQQNSLDVGDYFINELKRIQQQLDCIGDVRGSGLFIGIEFIKDENLDPDTALAALVKNELRNRNILVSTDGPYDSVIKSKPPLCFTKENVDQVISELHDIISK